MELYSAIIPRPASTEALVLYQFLKLEDWIDEEEILLDEEYPYSPWNVIKTLEMMGYRFEVELASYGLNGRGMINKRFRMKRGFSREFRAELQTFIKIMSERCVQKEAA